MSYPNPDTMLENEVDWSKEDKKVLLPSEEVIQELRKKNEEKEKRTVLVSRSQEYSTGLVIRFNEQTGMVILLCSEGSVASMTLEEWEAVRHFDPRGEY